MQVNGNSIFDEIFMATDCTCLLQNFVEVTLTFIICKNCLILKLSSFGSYWKVKKYDWHCVKRNFAYM